MKSSGYLLAAAAVLLAFAASACSPGASAPGSGESIFAASPTPGGAGSQPTASGAQAGGTLTVTSTAFSAGGNIPRPYTCDGSSLSPELKWSGAPASTVSYALIVDDPDAPVGTFTHWVAFDIPASQTEIAEGAGTVGKAGKNSGGKTGYTGPCPPSGTHRYIFNVYALDVPSLGLQAGASRDEVRTALQGHILAQGSLMGRYGR